MAFDPIFQEKVLEIEQAHPRANFHSGFDEFHLLLKPIGQQVHLPSKWQTTLMTGTESFDFLWTLIV